MYAEDRALRSCLSPFGCPGPYSARPPRVSGPRLAARLSFAYGVSAELHRLSGQRRLPLYDLPALPADVELAPMSAPIVVTVADVPCRGERKADQQGAGGHRRDLSRLV